MSTRVFLVISRLDCLGAARQLCLLAEALPRPDFQPLVCTLEPDGPLEGPLRARDVPVETLGWRRLVDPLLPVRLRQLLDRFQPDVIHAWHFPALRLLRLAGGWQRRPIVFSAPLFTGNGPGPLDRWLVHQVDAVVAQGKREAHRWSRLGLPQERIVSITPAQAAPEGEHGPLPPALQAALAQKKRFIACQGALGPYKGFRDAIWAFDILRFVCADLQLLLIGSGPDRGRLERFANDLGCQQAIHWLGERHDGPKLLRLAQVVWVPSLRPGGVNTAGEALAAGVPVVAARWPILAEIIQDGANGFLVKPGDKNALARKTRILLEDQPLRDRMSRAGQSRVLEQFSVESMVERLTQVYDAVPTKVLSARET